MGTGLFFFQYSFRKISPRIPRQSLFNETVVKEYDLVCERESTVVMFILFFNIGLTLGPLVAGKVSETIGECSRNFIISKILERSHSGNRNR